MAQDIQGTCTAYRQRLPFLPFFFPLRLPLLCVAGKSADLCKVDTALIGQPGMFVGSQSAFGHGVASIGNSRQRGRQGLEKSLRFCFACSV